MQSDAKILKYPAKAYVGDGDGILIVDDLVDTGKTFQVRKVSTLKHTMQRFMPNHWENLL